MRRRMLVPALVLFAAACESSPPTDPAIEPAFAKPASTFVADASLHAGVTPVTPAAPVVSNCSAGVVEREYVVGYFRKAACVSGPDAPIVQPTGSGLVLRVTDIRPAVTKGKTPTISMLWGVFAIDDATGLRYRTDHIFISPQIPDPANSWTLHVDQDNLPIYPMDPDTREPIPPAIGTISLWDVVYTLR